MHRFVVRFLALLLLTAALAAPGMAQIPDDLQLVEVASGFSSPVAARHAGDGSGRLFVVEQAGIIKIWDGSQVLPTPFLDITGPVASGGERGLLGLAFHPDYESNGFFYVNYTRGASPGETIIERYSVTANPNVADPASGVEILVIDQDFSNHNGGNVHFGPDGFLYIGMGDGGSGGDPNDRSQDPMELLGKMLRIDVDQSSPLLGGEICGEVGNYGIPEDNPFQGVDGTCDEIWALGLRNPWRWSFDRETGDLLIGDVGQDAREEVDFQPADSPGGENYGWRCFEGNLPFNQTGCLPPENYVFPIMEYVNGADCAITGGVRYRGLGVPGLRGTYMFGDSCSGRIWFATEDPPGTWSFEEWDNTSLVVVSFDEDEAGEAYVVDLIGGIHRFESEILFADGFESGDTSAWGESAN